VDEYYKILNLPFNASKHEVKTAYHKLALEYHPDICKLPEAGERFIMINLAYQTIIQKLDLDEKLKLNKNIENETAQEIINSWMASERERIRKRAQQHAEMHYNQFRKSKLYKSSFIFPKTLALFSLFFGMSIILGSVYGTFNQYKINPVEISVNYILSGLLVFSIGVAITTFSVTRLMPFFRRD
jgi:curved DNA-binding protein CbpA